MTARLDKRINLLGGAWCISAFAFAITFPFLPIYLHRERGYPMSLVGLVFPIMGVARMLSPLASGWLVDRFGRRPTLIAAPLLRALTFFVLAALAAVRAPLWELVIPLTLGAFFGSFFMNASDSYVTDITPSDQLTEAYSRIRVGLNIGWMIGPAVGAFLARTPFSLLFGLTGALCLVTCFIAWAYCPESIAVTEKPADPDQDEALDAEAASQTGHPAETPLPLWRLLAQDRVFLWHMVFCFFLYLVHAQLVSTLSIFCTGFVGVSKDGLGWLYALNGLLIILFQIHANRILGAGHLAVRIAIGAVLYGIGYFGLGFAWAYVHLVVAVIVFTSGEILTECAIVSATSRLASAGYVGRYMGVYGLVRGLGFSLGPFIGALLLQRFEQEPTWLWSPIALCAVVAAYGFARLRGEREMGRVESEECKVQSD